MSRFGIGYDAHRFDSSRPLILGGVQITSASGLGGHSDGDVLCHSLIDAILGASALGDIGKHFPEEAVEYGSSSINLLKITAKKLHEDNWFIENVDATIVTQTPRLSDYLLPIRKEISKALAIDLNCVSVKATTEDGLGYTGNEEGILVLSVASVEKKS